VSDLVDYAKSYLSAGLSIIALTGKRPNTHFHEHGLSDPIEGVPESKEDDELIERVFTHPDTTGVGILIPRFVYVADVDSDDAATLYMELAGGLPDTPVAKTRNGLHIWFWEPTAESSIWLGYGKVLLLRGLGSYVAAPPSEHPDGGKYTWLDPLVDTDSGSLMSLGFLPEPLREAILAVQKVKATAEVTREKTYIWQLSHNEGVWRLAKRLADPDITGLARAVAECPPGNRNNMLSWAAMTAAEDGIPYDMALEGLTAAGIAAGLDRRETTVTIKAAYRRKGKR
jgi:hypothetical protein